MGVATTVLVGLAIVVCYWLVDVLFLRNKRSPLAILPGPPSDHLLLGNMVAGNTPEKLAYYRDLEEKYGGVFKLHGIAGMGWQMVVSDPEALHSIFVSNADVWLKPTVTNTFNNLFFGQGLVTVKGIHTQIIQNYFIFYFSQGETHRRQRKTIAPIFSTQQMRAFLPSFYETSRSLCRRIRNDIAKSGSDEVTLDAVRFTSQIALDIVGNSAIGYEFDTINKDSEYSRAVKQLFPAAGELGALLLFLGPLSKFGPWIFRRFVMNVTMPWLGALGATVLRVLHVMDVMEAESVKIFNKKKEEIVDGGVFDDGPKDVMATLLRESRAGIEDALEENEILSQIQTMVFAGHETTSTVITKCLQELSQNQGLQEKLRLEFTQARLEHGEGDLDYETLQSLPLLDAVVREVLRLNAPVPVLIRQNTEDTIVPLAVPIKTTTGKEIKQALFPKDTFALIAADRMNRSKLLFGDDAEEFKPERWLAHGSGVDPTVKNAAVYSSIMTFSGGFRSCVGFKFAVLEFKAVIYSLITNFTVSPAYPDDEIVWHATTALFPVVRGQEDRGAQLPIKLRAL